MDGCRWLGLLVLVANGVVGSWLVLNIVGVLVDGVDCPKGSLCALGLLIV